MGRAASCRLIAFGCALMVALAGCGLTGHGHGDAGPPPGGWPQPAGGRVTTQMCGLLTGADYARLGHDRRATLVDSVNDRTNTLDCQYQATDDMTVALEPTADFAAYFFAADLKDHKKQLADDHVQSGLVSDVVGPADESWFDYWTLGTAEAKPVAHEIRVRRGALIIGITLSGIRGKKEKDPKSVLVALANLVLRRLPNTGLKDTGTTHQVQYEVIGLGKAKSIAWEDFTGIQSGGEVTDVRVPWLQTVSMATSAGGQADSPYLRAEASSRTAKIGCLILVDGVPVAAQAPQPGFADCKGDVPDTAQPASARSRPITG